MSDSNAAPPETVVPIKVAAPADNAPPSLAEPASGPVAELSGALPEGTAPAAAAEPAEGESKVTRIQSKYVC